MAGVLHVRGFCLNVAAVLELLDTHRAEVAASTETNVTEMSAPSLEQHCHQCGWQLLLGSQAKAAGHGDKHVALPTRVTATRIELRGITATLREQLPALALRRCCSLRSMATRQTEQGGVPFAAK